MEDYETASEMTGLLGNYFRYMTYSGEQESIPLLEEYRHAGDYLDIQKIRFQDNITVEMDELPEKYNYFRVPPFILQPLVENVFKHGIKDMAYAGCISVRVEETETKLCLIVRDNGLSLIHISMRGIFISIMKKSGFSRSYKASASIPSVAVPTS